MSDIDTMTIGEAKAAVQRGKDVEALLSGGQHQKTCSQPTNYAVPQIVILDRGFVYVGDVATEGDWLVIRNAKNVRRWGTTKGLGELAKSGPLTNTLLDPAGTVRAPLRAVIGLVECEASSWTK